MTALGLVCFSLSAAYLVIIFVRTEHRLPFGTRGFVGLAALGAASILLHLRFEPVVIFVTPITWTAYILIVDEAAYAIRGRSLLRNNGSAFAWMALLSVGLWLVFEAYNLRLHNWEYHGVPDGIAIRSLGYVWSFATIWPAVLETADLLLATQHSRQTGPLLEPPRRAAVIIGLAFLALPVLIPSNLASYSFGMVWLGFILLLDPLNEKAGRASLIGDLRNGDYSRLRALLVAGLICGFIWEFWNYWAGAKWIYVFPILQRAKIFEMPVPGYFGFPVFALEVFVMYVYVTGLLRVPYHEVQ